MYGARTRSKDSDVADLCDRYFSDQFSNPSKYDIEVDFSNDPCSELHFTKEYICDPLKTTNVNKAAGPDAVDSKLLKYCAMGLSRPLTKFLNPEKFLTSGS